jgi:hypothetical protein
LGIDPSVVQNRVSGSCSGTQMLQSVNQNGTVGCNAIAADGGAGTPTLRSLGTGGGQAAAGDDPRLSDARAPTGPAGGDLAGSSFPNPSLATGSVDPANFAALPHGRIRDTACTQTIADDGFLHQVAFDTLDPGSNGVTFSDAGDTMTVTTAGTYLVFGSLNWVPSGTGSRGLEVLSGVGGELAYDGRTGSSVVKTDRLPATCSRLQRGTACS